MPLSNGLRSSIAGQYGAIENQIDSARNTNGKRQMLLSHDVPPGNGNGVNPKPKVQLRPSDQLDDLDISLPPGMRFSMRVDVYDGPRGGGDIAWLFAEEDSVLYAMAVDYGLEGRSSDWDEWSVSEEI